MNPFIIMKTTALSVVLGVLAFLVPSVTHAATIEFPNQGVFDEAFPTASRSVIGGDSEVTWLESNKARLYAKSTAASSARVTIYSAASYSEDLAFTSAPLTITFNGAWLNFSGAGSTNNKASFGLTSTASGTIGSANAIYFRIERGSDTLSLMQSVNGTATALHTWSNAELDSSYNSIRSVTLTLTATTWEVSGITDRRGRTFSGSGSLGVTWTSGAWGANTYVGFETVQLTSTADRWSELQFGGVSMSNIPEPGTAGVIFGMAGLTVALMATRRRSSR